MSGTGMDVFGMASWRAADVAEDPQVARGRVVKQFTGPLVEAYKAKLAAQNDEQRLAAEIDIARIEAAREGAPGRLRRSAVGLSWCRSASGERRSGALINPWFGGHLVVIAVPPVIMEIANIFVPAILIADAGALMGRRMAAR